MKNAEPGSSELRMLEGGKKQIRSSGELRTVRDLAEFFRLGVDDLQSRLKGQWIRHKIFSVDDASAAELFPSPTHSSACEICVNTVLKR